MRQRLANLRGHKRMLPVPLKTGLRNRHRLAPIIKYGESTVRIGDRAIATFEKYLTINPDNKDAITNLSIEYKMVGRVKSEEQRMKSEK